MIYLKDMDLILASFKSIRNSGLKHGLAVRVWGCPLLEMANRRWTNEMDERLGVGGGG